MSKIFALVDCNNFYASCERIFRPDLKKVPIAVLSNNDGCVVARSAEVKAMGIKMGEPYFQVKREFKRFGVKVFSSNYTFYADISSRVMATLEKLAPEVEIYSIDEAFLDLTLLANEDLYTYGQMVKRNVYQYTGIPVCVGIAPTKTLAKLANHAAKKYPGTKGVVDLRERQRQLRLMRLVPVNEVWGIGRRLTERLQHMGINTALEFAQTSPSLIRSKFSVTLERTQRELNGISCIETETLPTAKQQIICSRSFGQKVTDIEQMSQAICKYVERACERLRDTKQFARQLTVFIRAGGHGSKTQYYSNSAIGHLVTPTNDTRAFAHLAQQLLKSIWRDNYRYGKGGVMLSDFHEPATVQQDLFAAENKYQNSCLMKTIDTINQSGKGRVFFAGQGINPGWSMRRDFTSPSYTTSWGELPQVR